MFIINQLVALYDTVICNTEAIWSWLMFTIVTKWICFVVVLFSQANIFIERKSFDGMMLLLPWERLLGYFWLRLVSPNVQTVDARDGTQAVSGFLQTKRPLSRMRLPQLAFIWTQTQRFDGQELYLQVGVGLSLGLPLDGLDQLGRGLGQDPGLPDHLAGVVAGDQLSWSHHDLLHDVWNSVCLPILRKNYDSHATMCEISRGG